MSKLSSNHTDQKSSRQLRPSSCPVEARRRDGARSETRGACVGRLYTEPDALRLWLLTRVAEADRTGKRGKQCEKCRRYEQQEIDGGYRGRCRRNSRGRSTRQQSQRSSKPVP
eukprot:6202895-Pleurochrysis_carterae.AAC.3